MKFVITCLFGATLLAPAVSALFPKSPRMQIGPIEEDTILDGTNGTNGWGTFEQLLDHSDPSLGTFSQRYWYASQWWNGPGSPVIMVNPGEQAADGFNITYSTTKRLTGLLAQQVGGAVVILEHRYWGESSPFAELTVQNLQYLTLENSLKDNTYFAENFDAPFDTSGRSSAKDAPWVFSGGSYPGALSGWLAALDSGTFWAYHATSGVVETVRDFYHYFDAAQAVAPANCSKDMGLVVQYVDDVLQHGSSAQKKKLKGKFGLDDLVDVDFAAAIETGAWLWQDTQFYTGAGNVPFFEFCDYVENVWPNSTNPIPGPEGVGECKALEGYAKWFQEVLLPWNCDSYGYSEWEGEYNTLCFASSNSSAPIYKDLTVGNPVDRQWTWMLCNEPFGWWQDGDPQGPTILSRLVNSTYYEQQCSYYFPPDEGGYGIAKGKTPDDVNVVTGGWSMTNVTRLLYVNGQYDPWRAATVSSDTRPGGPLESTPDLPVKVIPGGIHCSDLYGQNWDVNPELKSIVDDEIAILSNWIEDYYTAKKRAPKR